MSPVTLTGKKMREKTCFLECVKANTIRDQTSIFTCKLQKQLDILFTSRCSTDYNSVALEGRLNLIKIQKIATSINFSTMETGTPEHGGEGWAVSPALKEQGQGGAKVPSSCQYNFFTLSSCICSSLRLDLLFSGVHDLPPTLRPGAH